MDAAAAVRAIDADLRVRGDAGRAEHEKAYLHSDREHYGASVPAIRAVATSIGRRYADAMLDEKELFIRKAIGWVLRETAKKRPTLVYEWLLPRARRASGVTVREAIKPLSEQQRGAIMAAR